MNLLDLSEIVWTADRGRCLFIKIATPLLLLVKDELNIWPNQSHFNLECSIVCRGVSCKRVIWTCSFFKNFAFFSLNRVVYLSHIPAAIFFLVWVCHSPFHIKKSILDIQSWESRLHSQFPETKQRQTIWTQNQTEYFANFKDRTMYKCQNIKNNRQT